MKLLKSLSDYQFLNYAKVRKEEIEQDQNKKKTTPKKKKKKTPSEEARDKAGENVFDAKSSYRAYSRMHCSFVFPEDIPRPYPGDILGEQNAKKMVEGLEQHSFKMMLLQTELITGRDDLVSNYEKSITKTDDEQEKLEKEELKERIQKYEAAKNRALRELEKASDRYLIMDDPDKLLKYSPKYNTILKKINELEADGKSLGTAFVYTEYKTLEGIAVFSVILNANGYAPFRLGKNDAGEWIQKFKDDSEINKPKYAFWGGNEEESDIIRKIYNNDFEELPKTLVEQFKTMKVNNLRGDIIKVLMTTKSGAEGIDLHNVRQVHVVEPYWNPVRIKQVKGRAVRVGSHLQLPEADRNVEIYFYLSYMTKAQLKLDKKLQTDKDGMSSDEVLYDISQRKLQVMDHLLTLIKEASVDCGLNLEETMDEEDKFECLNFGTDISRDKYAFIPNVKEERGDVETKRRIIKVTWKPKKVTIKGKVYALRDGKKQLLYDYESTLAGRPGNPIGEITLTPEGKKKIVFKK